jgi:hypothetical protein
MLASSKKIHTEKIVDNLKNLLSNLDHLHKDIVYLSIGNCSTNYYSKDGKLIEDTLYLTRDGLREEWVTSGFFNDKEPNSLFTHTFLVPEKDYFNLVKKYNIYERDIAKIQREYV